MKTSVMKNSTDQSCGKGRRLKASGYAMNAKPGPVIGNIVKKCQGTDEIKRQGGKQPKLPVCINSYGPRK